jgi:hypothetical protein
MTVQRATTRKRIATVKLTEREIREILLTLADLEYKQDPRAASENYKSAFEKLRKAGMEFIRQT